MTPSKRLWLIYATITTLAWGLWGALLNLPASSGFPETLGYVTWSLTMIPPAVVALWLVDWKLDVDWPSVAMGLAVGLLGAGGQLVLFQTVPAQAPAYLVFPFIALNPLVTILLAAAISRERVHLMGWVGIALALVAGVLLNYQSPEAQAATTSIWWLYALVVLVAWGTQGFIISYANNSMKAESIFFYMMLSAVALAPFAWQMTDWSNSINWGWSGPGVSASIQILNSLGALVLVYAYRYGKAMIVAPLTNAGAPVITAILSLVLLRTVPSETAIAGIVVAVVATALMAIEEEPADTELEGDRSTGD
jgi:drug/metabolite transporter (DMT)-like permease